jgi:RNA polymerase sigma-70 factor (ECF subfamily)
LESSLKEDQRTIERFLAGKEAECRNISKWISQVVNLHSWGLNEYRDDILQEVLIKLYYNLRESRFQFASSLKTYVYRITKFTCIEYLRRRSSKEKKEVRLTEIQSDIDPEKEMEEKQERLVLWRVYRLMSEECRQLWKMIFWEDLSYRQIAQKLAIRDGTVKSRFARCKEKAVGLRKKLTEKVQPF